MENLHFDYLVIGGGSAGYAAARTARETLDKVAIVDDGAELGGLCILRGCMPSKTLIYSAEVLHHAQQGTLFGLDIPDAKVDMNLLHQRKLDTIKEFSDYRSEALESNRFTLFRNRAHFTGKNSVELDNAQTITADKIMISTGSVVQVPPVPGLKNLEGVWTSDDVLDLDFLPESVIVLGGGIVASELAQFLNRVGSKVIQIQRSEHILKDMSPEASTVIEKAFRDEGIELHTNTSIKNIEKKEDAYSITFNSPEGKLTRSAKYVFNALGRVPNTRSLNLEAAGIELLPSGHIKTGDYQVTDNPDVYAAGDVAGPHEIVHVAIIQGEAAAKHATGRKTREPGSWDFIGVVFTDPQIGTAGKSEKQLQAEGIDFLNADYPWDDHGKSILMEAKYGYVKVLADNTGKILGAEIVGKDAGELIHTFSVAISLNASVVDLLNAPWYHPTLTEMVTYPLEDIADELGLEY